MKEILIKDIANKSIITIEQDKTIYDACKLMKEYDIGFLPVTEKNKIVGIITDRDIAIRLVLNKGSIKDEVKNYMTRNVISANLDNTIDDVASIMIANQIRRMPVIDDGIIEGVVAMADYIGNDIEPQLCLKIYRGVINDEEEENPELKVDDYP